MEVITKTNKKLSADVVVKKNANGKAQTLDNILDKLSNIKIKQIGDNTKVSPSALNKEAYKTLTDNYTNYDIILVRITSSNAGGQGLWSTFVLTKEDDGDVTIQDNYNLNVGGGYSSVGAVTLKNDNQVSLTVFSVNGSGWNAGQIGIYRVYGIKF